MRGTIFLLACVTSLGHPAWPLMSHIVGKGHAREGVSVISCFECLLKEREREEE